MEGTGPEATATVAALLRAAHLCFDDTPAIFEDTLALALCGIATVEELRARLIALEHTVASVSGAEKAPGVLRYLRSIMTLRSRYTEEQLERAMARGLAQYVILGAGLDSFAYRRGDLGDRLQVFEVDLASTQASKRDRLRAAGVAVPPNLCFVPVDFGQQPLMEALVAAGYQGRQPAFFSWLGTTQYLTAEAVRTTLRELAAAAPGSELVIEYQLPEAALDEEGARLLAIVKELVARVARQPWQAFFETDDLIDQMTSLGYSDVSALTPQEATRRYFEGREDGLRYPQPSRLMKARR